MNIASWKETVEVLSALVTMGAITAGGIGAYFKFFKGRVFHTRLELALTHSWMQKGDTLYLQMSASAKNTGTSNVTLLKSEPSEHFLEVEVCDAVPNAAHWEICGWQRVKTLPLFEIEDNIEAGESITKDELIIVPLSNGIALKISVYVRARKNPFKQFFDRDQDYHTWKCEKIVYSPESPLRSHQRSNHA